MDQLHPPFHTVIFDERCLRGLLRETGYSSICVTTRSPSLWVAQSVISCLFAHEAKGTRALRSAALVASLTLLIRVLLFPALWFGDVSGRGDCLIVRARRRSVVNSMESEAASPSTRPES